MIFKQFYLPCLAHASYVVADDQTRTAVVVDPQRDVDQYLAFAAEHNLQIKYVFLTHLHADFVAGHLELRDRVGAQICLGAAAKTGYAFTPFAHDDTLTIGDLRLTILETPGHTPESISILVRDPASPAPLLLTGDTLFIGDVGRPDLRASLGFSAAQLGTLLYDTLHSKILKLPDETLIYPAHGAGSLCGKSISKETFSTLGQQRRTNYALQPMTREAFLQVVTADQPDAPAYFTYDAVLNSQERPTLDESLAREMNPLSLDEVLRLQQQGGQVLDTRTADEFAASHLVGATNIPLGGQYATWAGTILDRNHPIILITAPWNEAEAALRLGRIGFDHVAGYLDDGMRALHFRPNLTASTTRTSPHEASALLSSHAPPFVLDVRNPREYAAKHIPGSTNLPLNRLAERLAEIPRDRTILLHCAGGYRSSVAAGLLQRKGITAFSELAGGLAAWESSGLPVETSPA